jgi:hypothetical protein
MQIPKAFTGFKKHPEETGRLIINIPKSLMALSLNKTNF